MGLFDKFKQFKTWSDDKFGLEDANPDTLRAYQEKAAQNNRVIVLRGNMQRHVYIYDSRPLNDLKNGDRILLEAFPGMATMTSTATGAVRSTDGPLDCLMLYYGEPVGFLTLPREKVEDAARYGYTIKVNAVCLGWLEGYKKIKAIDAIVPERFYLHDYIPAIEDRPLRDREYYFSYNEYDEADYANIAVRDNWVFQDARLEMIPTPPNSSAKPHIGVYSSDGTLISEVAAKNGYYNDMIAYMGKYGRFEVHAKRRVSDMNGKVFYSIEIFGY